MHFFISAASIDSKPTTVADRSQFEQTTDVQSNLYYLLLIMHNVIRVPSSSVENAFVQINLCCFYVVSQNNFFAASTLASSPAGSAERSQIETTTKVQKSTRFFKLICSVSFSFITCWPCSINASFVARKLGGSLNQSKATLGRHPAHKSSNGYR